MNIGNEIVARVTQRTTRADGEIVTVSASVFLDGGAMLTATGPGMSFGVHCAEADLPALAAKLHEVVAEAAERRRATALAAGAGALVEMCATPALA